MKKLISTLLLAAFSLSTFAVMPPQQDTTKKTHKQRSKQDTVKTKKVWKKKTKSDTTKRDTTKTPPM